MIILCFQRKHFNYNKKFTPLPSPQLKQPKMNLKKNPIFYLFQKHRWFLPQNIFVQQI